MTRMRFLITTMSVMLFLVPVVVHAGCIDDCGMDLSCVEGCTTISGGIGGDESPSESGSAPPSPRGGLSAPSPENVKNPFERASR
ncbi:MAG: hypothetical protein ABIG71_04900, partial [Candidatus Uhrbacteria bacterium]